MSTQPLTSTTDKVLFYKESTPVSLNKVFLENDFFKTNWKLIPQTVKLLNLICRYNNQDKGKSSITYTKFKSLFKYEYPKVIHNLEKLDLLKVTRFFRRQYSMSIKDKGVCYSYLLTDKCLVGLTDTNKEYLVQLFNDPQAKRRNQKRISKRGHNKIVYNDIRDNLKATTDSISFNVLEVVKVVDSMPPLKSAFTYRLLIDIVEKNYSDLKFNPTDNRVWTPFTQLPAEVKKLIMVKGYKQQQVIDIRSCYPSLFATYIKSLFPTDSMLPVEVIKWNDLFLTKELDPKTWLATQLGLERSQIKKVMIEYFNGQRITKGSPFEKFDKWLQQEFPTMYRLWKTTDIKQTGNNIGKHLETKLMLSPLIYNMATTLNIVLGYEYDGLSLYAKNDSRCLEFTRYLEKMSRFLLGIQLVFERK